MAAKEDVVRFTDPKVPWSQPTLGFPTLAGLSGPQKMRPSPSLSRGWEYVGTIYEHALL